MLPETDETGAFVLAERIRAAVCACEMRYANCALHVTLSGGVGSWMSPETDIQAHVRAGGCRLYRAKVSGRNRIARASDVPESVLARFRAA